MIKKRFDRFLRITNRNSADNNYSSFDTTPRSSHSFALEGDASQECPAAPPQQHNVAGSVNDANSSAATCCNDASGSCHTAQHRYHGSHGIHGHFHSRLMNKNGEYNVASRNIDVRSLSYLKDLFTTLIDARWRYVILISSYMLVLCWLVFALVWWTYGVVVTDFSPTNASVYRTRLRQRRVCVVGVHDFYTALLFSLETQQTIGYGSRYPSGDCVFPAICMMMQCVICILLEGLVVGIIFTKISRPKKRAATIMWSRNAVICQRDGVLSLLFRVGDMRRTHIVESHVRGVLIQRHVTQEGEVIDMHQTELDFGFDQGFDRIFLIWPMELQHKISRASPFWEMGPEHFTAANKNFEVFIFFEGIVEATGMTTQARTSYSPGEILWGHRFDRLVTYEFHGREYIVDYEKFHSTLRIDGDSDTKKHHRRMEEEGEDSEKANDIAATATTDNAMTTFPNVSAKLIHKQEKNKRKESGSVRNEPAKSISSKLAK